ncbi:MAG: hypothetical protein NTY09_08770 [bacterium]|nr:hypothetical protein [bacterium]
MYRWTVTLVMVVVMVCASAGCSGSGRNPLSPYDGQLDTSVGTSSEQPTQDWLLNYYDIYFDIQSQTFEAVENRTASFTLNIVPFLNQMTFPKNGISFDQIVLNQDVPGILGVDVVFTVYHPFPGYAQYDAYDMRGILIGDGADNLAYGGLSVAKHGTDVWMKNPDGYSRWFNPTEFTTDKIFGYAPGGWQNYAGGATLNPYKYYSKHLNAEQDLWGYLTGTNNWDGVFENGEGRMMELEFVMPTDGIGLKFGYAIAVCWEEQGPTPPYHPVHVAEPVAARVNNLSDIWYNETDGSGGSLILDIDLFSWDEQPSKVKIESSVLNGIKEFDFDTYAVPGGENYYTWHVEAEAKPLDTGEGHYFWVIAECGGYNYSNGLPDIPHANGQLAAFFRYDLEIGTEPNNEPPTCNVVVTDPMTTPPEGWAPFIYTFDSGAFDPNQDYTTLTYDWDFDGDGLYFIADSDPDDSWTGSDWTPVHAFQETPVGPSSVRVTDDMGEVSECSLDEMLVLPIHQSKNIPLRAGYTAYDLGVDPEDGDIYIIYNDHSTYVYSLNDWYETYSDYFPTTQYSDFDRVDVAAGGWGIYSKKMSNPGVYVYDGVGIYVSGTAWGGGENKLRDVTNMGMDGEYANDLHYFIGYYHTGMGVNIIMPRSYLDELGYPQSPCYYSEVFNYNIYGINVAHQEFVQAIDAGIEGSNYWYLEAPDYYCAAFRQTGSGYRRDPVYNNSYFGTGTEETGDTCWTADVCDLAHDADGRFHVLDKVDGEAVIKVFSGSATGGTAHGSYGDATTIKSTPLRMDGSDFDGNMIVLHGNPTDGYFISLFLPSEFPD